MNTVYLVIGSEVEGSAALKAFASRERAEQCAMRCAQHNARQPQYPDTVEETPESEAAWAEADKRIEAWRKRHPGGSRAWFFNTFEVQPMRLNR